MFWNNYSFAVLKKCSLRHRIDEQNWKFKGTPEFEVIETEPRINLLPYLFGVIVDGYFGINLVLSLKCLGRNRS